MEPKKATVVIMGGVLVLVALWLMIYYILYSLLVPFQNKGDFNAGAVPSQTVIMQGIVVLILAGIIIGMILQHRKSDLQKNR